MRLDKYLKVSRLIKRRTVANEACDGERVTVQVKFREACGAPDPLACPMFIEVPRDKMNLSWQKYQSEDGEELESGKLWVTEWSNAGAFVDHSMDEFDALGV